MSSRKVGTQRAFDAAAADFAALGRHLWEPIGAATVAAAGLAEGDRVLDACCGTGASAIPAARAVGAGGVVDAIDLSGPMVGELRRLSADLPQLRAHEADATEWGTGGYDVVQCALGIFFFPDMTDGTERLIDRARSGGRAVFTIWRGGSMVAAGRHLGRAVAAVTDSAPPPEREPGLIDRINQAGPYGEWLSERNLSDVDVVVNELRLEMTPEVAWLVVIGSGFRGLLDGLEPGVVEQVRGRYLDSLRAEGVTELDATTLIGSGTVR
ncbi:class I SAM-dependent methyltransferase [Amycolatopsis roodepoortensis]|uniref:class I SAM-dependent methyltransferase n=1 Tax=Amycolatopsis roodepoortensis TaxID=700274 RepID=UPI00214AC64D|nr:class I SAM-dependent methyltransferase [Amycolatopsis roodepoortensis]UUV30960.1 class I SAM-dependent methyltransferase [Amycolatopsis roodepoortensis]